MILLLAYVDIFNGGMIFGYFSETSAILFFGISLILSTICLRWLLKRNDAAVKSIGSRKTIKR